MNIDQIANEVKVEVALAKAKFPMWPSDPFHAVAILNEEVGELNKAIVEATYEKGSVEEVRKEAIQAAAMSLRFLQSLDNYVYQMSNQHYPIE